jgi:hypothetical protein
MRISKERERFCFAGAIAAPDGVEAAVPVDLWTSAAAAPLGCCGASSVLFLSSWVTAGAWACATYDGASGSGAIIAGSEGFGIAVLGGPAAKADNWRLRAHLVTIATVLKNLRVIYAPAD